jgi:acyl dehydratase
MPTCTVRRLEAVERGETLGSAAVADLHVDLDSRHGPFEGALDPASIARYASATNDTDPGALAGTAVPPTYPVILVFDAQYAANAVVPREVFESGRSGVHGEHDVLLHRPLVAGEPLTTWSEPFAIRKTRAGTRVVLHMEQYGADGELAVEQWWTIFFAGNDVLADAGPEPPDHTFPDAARERPVGSSTQHVDLDQPRRYAEVSNDWSPHHFELEAAQRSGFDYLFAHGLCIMAMCSQAAVAMVADGDPSRVRRVAVRFASPTRLGEDLTVDVCEIDPTTYAFEATCAGAAVIKHGRLELFD